MSIMQPSGKMPAWFGVLALTTLASIPLTAGVFTESSVSANFINSTYSYAYNGPTNVYGALSSNTGLGFVGGCYPGVVSCAINAQGTTDTVGNLNTSFDNVTITGSGTNGQGVPVSGSATANSSANAFNATVGVYATGTHASPNGTEVGGTGIAQAGLSDTLHFTVAGASANTVSLLLISYTVTGTLQAGPFTSSTSEINAQLNFGGGSFTEDILDAVNTGFIPKVLQQATGGWVSSSVTSNGSGSFTFNGVYSVTGASANLAIYEYLSGFGGAAGIADYAHTGVVRLNLPTNVSFTSDSGVFLTQTGGGAAAPEPASSLLAGAGLVILVVGARRRNRRRTSSV